MTDLAAVTEPGPAESESWLTRHRAELTGYCYRMLLAKAHLVCFSAGGWIGQLLALDYRSGSPR